VPTAKVFGCAHRGCPADHLDRLRADCEVHCLPMPAILEAFLKCPKILRKGN